MTAADRSETWPEAWGIVSARDLAQGIGGRVWRVTTTDGATAIVKQVSDRARDEAGFALSWLAWRGGVGAARLLDTAGDFQLLEDVGRETLTAVLDRDGDAEATRIAATVLKTLGAPGPAAPVLPMMRERFDGLFRLDRPDEPLFLQARGRLERRLARPHPSRPLHGDVHHDNILNGPRGWLAIDPHGVVGDPAYEAANLLSNPVGRSDLTTHTDRAAALARTLAAAVERPVAIVLDYGFCHACLSAAWHVEDGDETQARAALDVARAISPLLNADDGLS